MAQHLAFWVILLQDAISAASKGLTTGAFSPRLSATSPLAASSTRSSFAAAVVKLSASSSSSAALAGALTLLQLQLQRHCKLHLFPQKRHQRMEQQQSYYEHRPQVQRLNYLDQLLLIRVLSSCSFFHSHCRPITAHIMQTRDGDDLIEYRLDLRRNICTCTSIVFLLGTFLRLQCIRSKCSTRICRCCVSLPA